MELPNLSEELNRKTFETLFSAYTDYKAKRISESSLRQTLSVVFSIVAGLVNNDLIELIAEIEGELGPVKTPKEYEIWEAGKDLVFVVEHDNADESFTVKTGRYETVKRCQFPESIELGAKRAAKLEKIRDYLINQGYHRSL